MNIQDKGEIGIVNYEGENESVGSITESELAQIGIGQ